VGAHHDTTTIGIAGGAVGLAAVRGTEAAMLLGAITALRLEGTLSDAEYQAKRQQIITWR
jgi:hypothetical protein